MPRKDEVDPATGIRYQGDVLNGKLSPLEAILREAQAAHRGRGPFASPLAGYDPVLRCHLRLEEPEDSPE